MRTRCRVHLDRLLEPEGGSAGNWGTPSEVQDAVDNRVRCWRPCWATRVLLVMRPDDGAGDSGGVRDLGELSALPSPRFFRGQGHPSKCTRSPGEPTCTEVCSASREISFSDFLPRIHSRVAYNTMCGVLCLFSFCKNPPTPGYLSL